MTFTSTDYDQQILDDARKLAALDTISQVAEYFTAEGRDDAARNPLPSFFGRGTLVIRDLLAIIDRQNAEITTLRDALVREEAQRYGDEALINNPDADGEPPTHVPMICTDCGKPVHPVSWTCADHGECSGRQLYQHDTTPDALACRGTSAHIQARVDA